MSQDDLFSKLPPSSFDGITIPVIDVEILTGNAAVFHSFPYRPGAVIEYMGREPVSGVMTASYFNGVGKVSQNVLWPYTLETLRNRAQEQRSGPLVISPYGTLPKAMIKIHEKYGPNRRDGSDISINFWEDSLDLFTKASVVSALGKIEASAAFADQKIADLKIPPDETLDNKSFLQSVQTFTNQLNTLQTNIAAPFQQAAAIVGAVDNLFRTVSSLQDVSNWEAADAFRELKANTLDALKEAKRTRPLKRFEIVARTNVLAIASASNNTVAELMGLNDLQDPNDIDRGEILLVYAA